MGNFFKWPDFQYLFEIFATGLENFLSLEFSQINYANWDLAVQVGLVVIAFVIIKLLIRLLISRNEFRTDSGHSKYAENKRSIILGLIVNLPYMLMVIPLAFFIIAISDPFLTQTKEEVTFVETRIRVDIKDISGSMVEQFKNSGLSKSLVALNSHLEFLKRRAGQGDRASLWVFGSEPHLIQNFTLDDDVYYLQAHDAPFGISNSYSGMNEYGEFYTGCVPSIRYACYPNDTGGTVLSKALEAVIVQFDEDEKKQKNSPYFRTNAGRAIVIITDAAISDIKEVIIQFQELKKRNIVPYLIWINEAQGTMAPDQSNIDVLLAIIQQSGGKYFAVGDEAGFTNAYLEIDKLEKVKIEVKKIYFKIPLFQNFIIIAILSLLIIIPLGLLSASLNHP